MPEQPALLEAPAPTPPLEIKVTVGMDEEVMSVYARGHHPAGAPGTPDPFLTAAKRLLVEKEGFELEYLDEWLSSSDARLEWWRCVPRRVWWDGQPGRWTTFHPATPGRPGAFPVTVLRVDHLL